MTPCEHEQRTVEAMMRGRIPPDVEAHVAACEPCREVRDAVQSMSALAASTDRLAARRRLPEASQLWWKGQLTRRWEAEARAVAPLDMMQRLEVGAGLVAALVLLVSFVRAVTPETSPGDVLSTWAGAANSASMVLWATIAVTVVMGSVLLLRRVLGTASS